jgi:Mg-chelatase subunit ChlI
MPTHHPYPFTALVGSDDLVLALVLSAVSPDIGGVLVRGEKGTAKSTAVRGLADVLPPIEVVAGDRFSVDPAHPETSPDAPFAGAATQPPPGPPPPPPPPPFERPVCASGAPRECERTRSS